MMDVEECFEKGLLKREKPDDERSKRSVEIAKYKLGRARKLFDLGLLEETLTNSYSAMFHAARALLFRDGVREKSHFGLFVYIKERYSGRLERRFVTELNALRLERHEISYGLEKPEITESEAGGALEVVEDFIAAAEILLRL